MALIAGTVDRHNDGEVGVIAALCPTIGEVGVCALGDLCTG
jgi:hypothetical protein